MASLGSSVCTCVGIRYAAGFHLIGPRSAVANAALRHARFARPIASLGSSVALKQSVLVTRFKAYHRFSSNRIVN